MFTLAQHEKALELATRIATYCHTNALTLGGIVVELDNGAVVDPAMAKRITTYCDQVQCLTLGGLVDEVWALRNEYADSEAIGEVIAEDTAERLAAAGQRIELSKVEQLAAFTANAMAKEVAQMFSGVLVSVDNERPFIAGLAFILSNGRGERLSLQCSTTTLERLAEAAQLLYVK